eukprot:4905133-Amphidinium_carterae.1
MGVLAEPVLLEVSGATQVRPGRARPRARIEGLAGPLQLRAVQAPQVRPGSPVRRIAELDEPVLLEATGVTQVRPGPTRGSARVDGFAGPLQLRAVQDPQ